jgi:hypothetical protein
MTIDDAIKMWLDSHNLKAIFSLRSKKLGWYTGFSELHIMTTHMELSNGMFLKFNEEFVQITGSLSKKSYTVNIADPALFPVLDRALDEEDKWIRDGGRAPE